jgi:hypothetical protein
VKRKTATIVMIVVLSLFGLWILALLLEAFAMWGFA